MDATTGEAAASNKEHPSDAVCISSEGVIPSGAVFQAKRGISHKETLATHHCCRVYHPHMLGGRTNEQWIAQYSGSHQHPVNRLCHTLGIPTILVSVAVFVAGFFFHRLWLYALGLFVMGWILQFIGHAFEGKPPEFFSDWRFLFVGVRWWWAKINGKA